MRVHQFQIPTGLYLGPVNVYLVDESPLTLIDTGPNLPEALDALRKCVEGAGHRLEDIQRIVVTHLHEDHSGLAATIQRISNAVVFAHPWEADRLRGYDDYLMYLPLLERAGVPPEVIQVFRRAYAGIRKLGEDIHEIEGIEDGDLIDFDRGSFEVLHTPGHTPGSVCLYRAADRSLIAADTVLANISPNPVLSPDPLAADRRFQSLGEYLVSMSRIRELAPTVIHGGHGPDVTDFESHFLKTVRSVDERQAKLEGLLPTGGASPWEACVALFPAAKDAHRFLALSETIAQLDFGVSEGRFRRSERGDVEVYARTRGRE
ncbi:MAG: MBL fold metallo-hydrolase [Acidobacteria bacterium]|nr:MBL fold metallo-hydrolase [Acidobacteriota bacterium]